MAAIELNAHNTLDIQVWRTEDEAGEVTLIVKTDDGTVRIRCGITEDDADRVAGALATGTGQASRLTDDWDDRPDEDDGYVTLSRDRYWVLLHGSGPMVSSARPESGGYPDIQVAIYELARLMAERGDSPPAWAEGEHGPTTRPISAEVRAFLDEGGEQLLPLDGVVFEPGEEVRYDGDLMEVVRDYGQLGVWLVVAGDWRAGEAFVRDRSRVQPVYEPGQLIEYVSHAWNAATGDPNGQWLAGLFVQHDTDSGQHAYVRTLRRPEPMRCPVAEIRPVPPSVLSAARGWIADNVWEDIADEGDVADLSDAEVVAGIQRHCDGGWAGFRREAE
jgi:hypothetical protein